MARPNFDAEVNEFKEELRTLLTEKKMALQLDIIFIDRLGNKHVLPKNDIFGVELRVAEIVEPTEPATVLDALAEGIKDGSIKTDDGQ